MAVAGDQRALGGDRSPFGFDRHLAAALADRRCLGHLEDFSAGIGGDPRQPDQQLQRMDVAGADIAHAAMETLRTEPLLRFLLVHEAQMRIAVA